MKKICVIGSAGFIAGYVTEELHKQGHYVIGLQRHQPVPDSHKDMFDSQRPDEIYYGDITNAEIVSRVVSISDGVINLAGILGTSELLEHVHEAVDVNIHGTLNVLEGCRRWNKPFVQIAVGNYTHLNNYSISRTAAERYTRMYAYEFGIRTSVTRALNAYGPRQSHYAYKKIIPSFVLNALHNKPLMVNGDGQQIMDMIFCADLAKFLVMSLLDPEKAHTISLEVIKKSAPQLIGDDVLEDNLYGNCYQCGEGDALTVNEIAELIIKLSGSSSEIQHRPMRSGERKNAVIVADYKSPTYEISLEEGLRKTIDYYRENLDRYTV